MPENVNVEAVEEGVVDWVKRNAAEMPSDTVFVFPPESATVHQRQAIEEFLERTHGGPPPFAQARQNIREHDVFNNDLFPAFDHEDGTDVEIGGERRRIRDAEGNPTDLGRHFERQRAVNDRRIPNRMPNAVYMAAGRDPYRSVTVMDMVARATDGQVSVVGSRDNILNAISTSATSDDFWSSAAFNWGAPVRDPEGAVHEPRNPHSPNGPAAR